MPTDRRQGRILAMQVLCQWDVQKDASPEALEGLTEATRAGRRASKYARKVLEFFRTESDRVNGYLSAATENWDLSRISPVERNTMRVAVVELLTAEVPPKVAITEAIEIAREYGGADSPKFVNGLLDAVLKRL